MHRHRRPVLGGALTASDEAGAGWRGSARATYLRFGMPFVFAIFALLLAGAAVMLVVGPRSGYQVSCTRDGDARCTLEQCRVAAASLVATRPAAALDSAVVRVMHPRKGRARVLLYMHFGREALFAAEFEGAEPEVTARQRAAELNRFVADAGARTVRFEESPPGLLVAASWIGLGVAALLVITGWRAGVVRRRESCR